LSARVLKQAQNFMRNGLRLCPEWQPYFPSTSVWLAL